jgi:4'-phosphopantetheinyl transferase
MFPNRQIHVSIVPLRDAEAGLWDLLDDAERARVERYRFEDDRRRATVGRGMLRRLLGQSLGRDPRALQFVTGEQGKPALTDGELEFNVSHSGDRVAIAIARGMPVGIDVELESRRMRDLSSMARRFFSPIEARAVEEADDPAGVFFTIWTAKEAVIKAVGGGLSINLASFSVLPVGNQLRGVRNLGRDTTLDGWTVASLEADAGYRVAVSVRGSDWEIVRV